MSRFYKFDYTSSASYNSPKLVERPTISITVLDCPTRWFKLERFTILITFVDRYTRSIKFLELPTTSIKF
jgi:hypothetical protein